MTPDELLDKGYRIRALDNLSPQVHGGAGLLPNGAKVQYRNIQVKELK